MQNLIFVFCVEVISLLLSNTLINYGRPIQKELLMALIFKGPPLTTRLYSLLDSIHTLARVFHILCVMPLSTKWQTKIQCVM